MTKISPKKAIANYCAGCIYDSKAGGTRLEQIEHCSVVTCELYLFRPLTKKTRLAMRTPEQIENAEKRRQLFDKNNPFLNNKAKD